MGNFTKIDNSSVSFGPAQKLSVMLIKKGFVMSTNDSKEKQITAFLGRMAYAAQAQEFVSSDVIDINLNQSVLFGTFGRKTEEAAEPSPKADAEFSLQSSKLATRIGCRPLYSKD